MPFCPSSFRPVRVLTWLALFCLVSCYPLSFVVSPRLGWENGAVENTQVVVLLAGLFLACRYAVRTLDAVERAFWMMAAPFWFIFIGREMSWGAVLLTPLNISDEGPEFSSRVLWYKPAVYPALGVLLGFSLCMVLAFRLWRVFMPLVRARCFPWLQLGLSATGILVATNAEGHGWFVFDLSRVRLQVLEEIVELGAYVSLLAAQVRIRYGFGPTAR